MKRAYTRLARRYHPDINPGDREAEAFYRSATEAYETLCDPERRAAYDTHGERQSERRAASIEFHGFDFSVPVTGTSATFAELFSEVLRETSDEPTINAEKRSWVQNDVCV
jgi:molecular chaperone DnaJ